MECINHPRINAVDHCVGCAESFCFNCLVELQDQRYCGECKIMAISRQPLNEAVTIPSLEAKNALKYAILSLFCFGFIFGPMAINQALTARKVIATHPNMTGSGKVNAAIVLAALALILWVIGVFERFI